MMSDVEEPPSKITKIELETSQPHDESLETAEHGQEEWLSEEVLTDEDYNQTLEQDVSQEGNTSQDDSQFSMAENSLDTADQINKLEEHLDEYQEEDRLTEEDQTVMEEERLVEEDQTVMEEERLVEEDQTVMEEERLIEEDQTVMEEERLIEEDQTVTEEEHTVTDKDQSVTDKDQTEEHVDNVKQEVTEADVEEQLNSLENVERKDKEDKKPGMFLVRKSDGQVDVMTERKDSSEFEPSEKHSDEEDDGNNTDELLRMLGEDNNKAKKAQLSKNGKKQLTVKKEDADSSDSDFEGALVTTTMKVAKRVLMNKKPARKAEPEDMSDSEQSEEENRAMADAISSRHYQVKKKLNVASKSTAKSSITSRNMSRTKPKTGLVSAQKTTSNSVKNSVKSVANGSSVKKTTKVPELSPKISERAKSLLQKMNSSIINNGECRLVIMYLLPRYFKTN
ncbi:protein IWS1 homolog isoform X2 [Plutella xylostella]|uniref:protein IWS1 homolog isoform X2 n=1 Tax=Plutella xylostella TaxID=51655 RepID=UPI0020329BE4|nr:protein IWS1 homolog isoform X2 [Plutella xylostella]